MQLNIQNESIRNYFILLCLLIPCTFVFGQQAEQFQNPIMPGAPDPWMTYYEGNYYFAATTGGSPSKGITIRKAPTIAELKKAEEKVVWKSDIRNISSNYWAPEFYFLNGPNGPRWYCYFTGGAPGNNYRITQYIHVLESEGTDIMGPYTCKGKLIKQPALDPTILNYNGRLYVIYSVWDFLQGLAITELKSPWETTGPRSLISIPFCCWETKKYAVNEGPEILCHDDRIFIIYSASSCETPDYKLGMLEFTGGNPCSNLSWKKYPKPVFERNDDAGVFGPGHCFFFNSPDATENWICYHANDLVTGGCDGARSARIQKISWKEDGTPDFGVPLSVKTWIDVPSE